VDSQTQFSQLAIDTFAKLGIKCRSISEFENPLEAVRADDVQGIFIGGGNTFNLLKLLYDHKLIGGIRERVQQGLPYMGSSAGTVVACPGIYTTNDMPIVEPKSLTALGLVPFQINPHFVPGSLLPGHNGETREERIRQFHRVSQVPVVGVTEGSWIEVRGTSYVVQGGDEAILFRPSQDATKISSGQSFVI
jgi:dipeptidase E